MSQAESLFFLLHPLLAIIYLLLGILEEKEFSFLLSLSFLTFLTSISLADSPIPTSSLRLSVLTLLAKYLGNEYLLCDRMMF